MGWRVGATGEYGLDQGSNPQDVTGKHVVVWEKVEGGWKLTADIWNDGKLAGPRAAVAHEGV
jgi:ketosteroid isomerase-like protein